MRESVWSCPIARSEIVCLRFYYIRNWQYKKSQLLWSIAPSDPETFKQLREKIKSKMDTAKLLGTFILFLLGIVLGIISDNNKFSSLTAPKATPRSFFSLSEIGLTDLINVDLHAIMVISVVCLFAAAVLFLMSMYAYDRLLMPTRFWAEGIKKSSPTWLPQRPPSSSLLILQKNMERVWMCLFTPAVFFVLLSLIGFAFVVMRINPIEYVLAVIVFGVLIFVYHRHAKPHIGTED